MLTITKQYFDEKIQYDVLVHKCATTRCSRCELRLAQSLIITKKRYPRHFPCKLCRFWCIPISNQRTGCMKLSQVLFGTVKMFEDVLCCVEAQNLCPPKPNIQSFLASVTCFSSFRNSNQFLSSTPTMCWTHYFRDSFSFSFTTLWYPSL